MTQGYNGNGGLGVFLVPDIQIPAVFFFPILVEIDEDIDTAVPFFFRNEIEIDVHVEVPEVEDVAARKARKAERLRPADAVLLLRAAIAAQQPAAAEVLRTWAHDPAAVDVRLAALAQAPRP